MLNSDCFMQLLALKSRFCYATITLILKKELKYIPILGLAGILSGYIFLNRGKSDASRAAINEAGKRAKKSGIRDKS